MGLPYSKEVYLDYVGISDEEVQENYRRIYASYGHDTVEEFIRRSYDDTLQEFRSGNVPLKPSGGISRLLDDQKFLDWLLQVTSVQQLKCY